MTTPVTVDVAEASDHQWWTSPVLILCNNRAVVRPSGVTAARISSAGHMHFIHLTTVHGSFCLDYQQDRERDADWQSLLVAMGVANQAGS